MTLLASSPSPLPVRPRNTLRRLLWVAVPLLTVAWYAAPEWPARVAMTNGPWRDRLYPAAQHWAAQVASVEQRLGVHRSGSDTSGDDNGDGRAAGSAGDDHQDGPVSPEVTNALASLASDSAVTAPVVNPPVMLSTVPSGGGNAGGSGDGGAGGPGASGPNGPTSTLAPTPEDQRSGPSAAAGAVDGPHGTLLAVGDSLMAEVAAGLKEGLPDDLKVKDAHKVSTGLTNRGYYNWPEEAKARAASVHPDWVVVHMGGNDGQDMLIDKRWVHFGSDEWKATYLARAEELIDNVRAVDPGVKLVWIGLPAMRDAGFGSKMSVISTMQKAACDARGVPYVDGHLALGPTYQKEGTFDGHRKVWRADDGIHYSREGGRLLARAAAKDPVLHWDWSDTRR